MAIVGAPNENNGAGAAYIYFLERNYWSQKARLSVNTPAPSAKFGSVVAIDGNTVAERYSETTLAGTVPAGATAMRLWLYSPQGRTLKLDDLNWRYDSCAGDGLL